MKKCVYCGKNKIHKHGKIVESDGVHQRYRCPECGKTMVGGIV